jgi:hypothetical protein
LSFFAFLRRVTPPILDEFGSMKQATRRYLEYLHHMCAYDHTALFLKGRISLFQRAREVLNTMTATGAISPGNNSERLLTFRQWTRANNNSPEPVLSIEAQLWRDVHEYEHSYLGQSSNAGMLLDFRAMRDQIRINGMENFSFHPHIEGLQSFQEWVSESTDPELGWDRAMEEYPVYLRESGHSALVDEFEEARRQHARADRREFKGLPRADPESTPGTFPNPTSASESYLDTEFRRASAELTTRLTQAITTRSAPRHECLIALGTIGGLIHLHRRAASANRPRTLEEWELIRQEFARIEELIPLPPTEVFLPRPPQLEPAPSSSPSPVFDAQNTRLVEPANINYDPRLEDDPNLIIPAVATQNSEVFADAERGSVSSEGSSLTFVSFDSQWFAAENGQPMAPSTPEESDSIIDRVARMHRAWDERVAERIRREQHNERPLTPDMEDGMSEMDEDEAAEVLLDMLEWMGFNPEGGRD